MKAKTIELCAKCSDMFSGKVVDKDGNLVLDYDGYVPKFFPGSHFGDYIEFDIDLETGQILNWVKPTEEDIEDMRKNSC